MFNTLGKWMMLIIVNVYAIMFGRFWGFEKIEKAKNVLFLAASFVVGVIAGAFYMM